MESKNKLQKNLDVLIALFVICAVLMIIIPLPSVILDLFIALNITLSVIIFIITLFTTNVLQVSIFPTLLLITTLFRLGLNISSTRLILSEGSAGSIIEAFGSFVIGGNYVVGIIIFIIIVVIQFAVITNGSSRVSEVNARFTLDAMPGKQVAIDTELSSGAITEEMANKKRKELQQEAEFYGAMDGASKFVKGDAIAGIIITLINIVGGIIIGVMQLNYSFGDAASLFTRLTVGDGLVSQVPSLLISTASGILVTRSGSELSFGKTFTKQISAFPISTAIASAVMFMLFIIPGMPKLPFLVSSIAMGIISYLLYSEETKTVRAEGPNEDAIEPVQSSESESTSSFIDYKPLEIEIGYGLIPLVDKSTGGDLLDRVSSVRKECAKELGIILQPIRIRDNLSLKHNQYCIKIKGITVATAEVKPKMYLCMNPTGDSIDIDGIEAVEPAFNIPALWISEDNKEEAEFEGLTVVDASTVIVTHLTEVINNKSHELIGRQEIKMIIDEIKEKYSAVVEELIPNLMGIGDIQKVLQNLLREKVSIKDIITILETLADNAKNIKDTEILTEHVRIALGRVICENITDENNRIGVTVLSPEVEEIISNNVSKSITGSFLTIDPATSNKILEKLKNIIDVENYYNNQPVMLVAPNIRPAFKRYLDMVFSNIMVISLNEIPSDVEIYSKGVISFDN
ncbi:flagellar biosynthesis protein FlhA [Clostridium sp.]|uniref:flagellar biosynthesis protein FlhA n=1 Tax=Clostridium sp. TaxID=1506 RepID=UPI001B50BC25|nr:flagellar biosynthesis protein FlhA [Clostridium sp.]MBP3917392.1 flagellar biosynthesis protein FlhA [Clostridium sp.]